MQNQIKAVDGKFHCATCDSSLTLISQNGGAGLKTRCPRCKKTYFYPACEKCGQATWNHDAVECKAIHALANGKKLCRNCMKVKKISQFNAKNGGLSSRCKDCQSNYFKEWYKSQKSTPVVKQTHADILDELFRDI